MQKTINTEMNCDIETGICEITQPRGSNQRKRPEKTSEAIILH